jgi:hypothetical protein
MGFLGLARVKESLSTWQSDLGAEGRARGQDFLINVRVAEPRAEGENRGIGTPSPHTLMERVGFSRLFNFLFELSIT